MPKVNLAIANLLTLICVFWLNSSGLSAEPCPPECPGPTSTITENAEYKDSWIFKWADDNPEFIPLGESEEVRVEGGVPNFKWQVSGDGFSLKESETTDRTNTLYADGTACGEATITVEDYHKQQVQGTVRAKDESFVWDELNSPIQFPSKTGSVDVYVTGGQGPYAWEVSNGFTLACTSNCGTSNTVSSQGTDCVAEITVTDSCGSQASGEVRRPDGYWGPDTIRGCYRYKLTTCYNNPCNSNTITVEEPGYKVQFTCCGYRGLPEVTGKCKVDGVPDGFEFTANIADCDLSGYCYDDPDYDPGIFSLYIFKWTCF
jgi:hypothetical protein